MSDTISRKNELDNYGVLTEAMPTDAPQYDFRKIRDYCRQSGKSLSELTPGEIDRFRRTS